MKKHKDTKIKVTCPLCAETVKTEMKLPKKVSHKSVGNRLIITQQTTCNSCNTSFLIGVDYGINVAPITDREISSDIPGFLKAHSARIYRKNKLRFD